MEGEDVFQAWLVNRHALDFAGEGLDHIGNEAMPVFNLEADLVVDDRRLQSKALFDVLRQSVWFVCFEQDHVAANFALQFCRSAQRDHVAFGVDR